MIEFHGPESMFAPAASVIPPRRPATVVRASVPSRPAPSPRANWFAAPAVGLSVPIEIYSDCSGLAPLTRSGGARYSCAPPGVVVLVGHNPGPFTPMTKVRMGDSVTYWDELGLRHQFFLRSPERLSHDQASALAQDGSRPHLVLITCGVPDGSVDWVIEGEPAMLAAAGE
ncbi:MAG: sortase domain-containing protein [Candidatus Dormibacteria bacterium]